mmetsp:Transcript_52378/g.117950  ORF Transcript_52378/g.117950 Transcript_52378/m.117950 type:complete len:526 (+) Transcript_52378:117-1694(+)
MSPIEPHAIHGVGDRRQQVVNCLSSLGSLSSQLSIIVVQQESECDELRSLGWAAVKTSESFMSSPACAQDYPPGTLGILVIQSMSDYHTGLRCCTTLDEILNAPPIIAVLHSPFEAYTEAVELVLPPIRREFLETGADDVISLFESEVLTPHRVLESIQRTEIMASKAAAMIEQEVALVKRRTARTLQLAWSRFMWDLPGKVLDSIPPMDENLQQRGDEPGGGIGDYRFTTTLGVGSFGSVFKAEHPTHGTVAVKTIAKSSVKNMSQLFSIETELCIMTNLTRHPRIVFGYAAMHTSSKVSLVMNYAGDMNLHTFTAKTIKGTGSQNLPPHLTESFAKQQVSAVLHLHTSLVCHRDLKPTNFVVDNGGSSIRLTDFGLSVILSGPEQRLTHCCGTLPFIAPEVLQVQMDKKADGEPTSSYNGLHADIWSLAANLVELICGLYKLEQLLGWTPQPQDPAQRLHDLRRVEEIWASRPEMQLPELYDVMSNMFVLRPEDRWTIQEVASKDCLVLDEVPATQSRTQAAF